VIAAAPSYLDEAGVAGRVEVVSGSFFEGVPAGRDYYVLKNVLHDWGDHECGVVLRRVAKAIQATRRCCAGRARSRRSRRWTSG
jgi:O-methyltransferase domain